MKLEVRLFANLRDLLPKESQGTAYLEFSEGITVNDLVKQLKIPKEIPLIIMVNGKRESDDQPLKDGDRVGIFPPVGGG